MSKLNKSLFLGWIIGGPISGIMAIVIGAVLCYITSESKSANSSPDVVILVVGILLILIGLALLITGVVFSCVLLYKAWQAIQEVTPRTTPGKAVGFLFIPFFNLYWIFQAYWGFSQDCNKYLNWKSVAIPKLSEGLFLACSILWICSRIPYLNYLAGTAFFVIFIIVCNAMIDVINCIVSIKSFSSDSANVGHVNS